MTDHPNAALLKKGFEAFSQGDTATITNLFAEEVVWHLLGRHQV